MKKTLFTTIAVSSLLLWTVTAVAGPQKALDRDCTAEKAAKNIAMKATIGVGGPCGPADAAKDTAKGVADMDDKKDKKRKEKDKKGFKK